MIQMSDDEWNEFKKNPHISKKQIVKKKETLEEAAERLYPVVIKPILDVYDDDVSNQIGEEDINEDNRESFIEGAKWQAERMYNEEDLEKAIEFGYQLRNNNKPINSGIDWVKEFNSLNK